MTSRFREVFSNRHVILPVIHVESDQQAVRNALVARDAGCDGVFLINHGVGHQTLINSYVAVKEVLEDFWVGINSLGREPAAVFSESQVDGLWTDNAGIDENSTTQPYADSVNRERELRHWNGLTFGGVAFKYQPEVTSVGRVARIAADYMDVVTTSGPGTGVAASVDKIRIMKEAIGEFPLAIASGITPENVGAYLPYSDCFLVATGISHDFTRLDPGRVAALVRQVRMTPSLHE